MPYKPHPLITTPKETAVWKYLDLAKFLNLITTSSLYFNRLDSFEDPYEGYHSNPDLNINAIEYKNRSEKWLTIMDNYILTHKKSMYVSCWHMNEYESAAMWKLYSQNEYGIAIKSSISRLKRSVSNADNKIHIGKIKYLDYMKERIPKGNVFNNVMHKRKSFEHEREVRAVIWGPKNDAIDCKIQDKGLNLKVNLRQLIDEIYISPSADPWIAETVDLICTKYKIRKCVRQSDLYKLVY